MSKKHLWSKVANSHKKIWIIIGFLEIDFLEPQQFLKEINFLFKNSRHTETFDESEKFNK